MTKKSQGNILLFGSVILIVIAIAVTALINALNKGQSAPTDIRAKAGVSSAVKVEGMVTDVDTANGTITVDNVQFEGNKDNEKNLGSWTVTPPPGFNLASIASGTRVLVTVDSASFLVSSHTTNATSITLIR